MRTIDEEIVSLRKSASKSLDYEWQREQYQLADWLEELKQLRLESSLPKTNETIARHVGYEAGYNNAIDDFVNKLIYNSEMYSDEMIIRMGEQLKEGGENE